MSSELRSENGESEDLDRLYDEAYYTTFADPLSVSIEAGDPP